MGIGRPGRERREEGAEDAEETASVAASERSAASSAAVEEIEVLPGTRLLDAYDNMKMKRRETREIGVKDALKELQLRFHGDTLSGREETTVSEILKVAKKAPSGEMPALCHLLDASVLTIGGDRQALHEEISRALSPILCSCSPVKGAPAAARSLGISTLVLATEEDSEAALLALLRDVLLGRHARSAKRAGGGGGSSSSSAAAGAADGADEAAAARAAHGVLPVSVAEAALEAWALVAASQRPSWLRGRGMREHWPVLAQYLLAPSLGCRAAAGRCLALLREGEAANGGGHGAPGGEEEAGADSGGDSEDEGGEGDEDEEAGSSGSEEEGEGAHAALVGREAVVGRLRELSRANPRTLKRRERKGQRQAFRALLEAVEDGCGPQELLRLGAAGEVEVDSWRKACMMHGVRRVLAGGLDAHLRANPLLGAMFDVRVRPAGAPDTRMSAVEKRLTKSKNSGSAKARSQKRAADRGAKGAFVL